MDNHPKRNLGHWAHQIMTAFQCEANKSLQEFGIGFSEAVPLMILYFHGPDSLVEIANRLNFSHPSVLRQIDSLEKLGLVLRTPHPEDRRVKIVKLTDQGKELAPKIMEKIQAINKAATSGISDNEVDLLFTMLNKILINLSGEKCQSLKNVENHLR
ncbi:MAG: MarR family transcriptional regulator [Bacteroidetes bacterium]|nr:MarR family transcriptional regulator [Bacteroidota bacterium]MBT7618012.1 MarR family transcriptional regulator [Calditrichota bacterium]